MTIIAATLEEALEAITDGCLLAAPREVSGVPMEATRSLIRRGVKKLHFVALPTSSLQADMLIGAGAIATLETSAVSLGELGNAPRLTDDERAAFERQVAREVAARRKKRHTRAA